jgi:peptidoglycan glycosyltransferase
MHTRLRQFVNRFAGIIGLIVLLGGLLVPDSTLWRLMLLLGLWLLSLMLRSSDRRASATKRGLSGLLLVFGLGFAAVGLQLARDQIGQAGDIRTRMAALQQPGAAQQPGEPPKVRPADRTELGAGRSWPIATSTVTRGMILDRGGQPLALTQNGRRVYPNPNLGQIVGFDSRLYGTTGVEASFDDYLSGARSISPDTLLQARLLGTPVKAMAANVKLTLDSGLQGAAEAALGERAGAVVLLDAQSGAILALASFPRFDPNQLVLPERASDADVGKVQAAYQALTSRGDSPLLNRATQGRYPPGSVIKTLTAAAALDARVLDGPEGQVTCPNRLPTEAGAPPVRNAVENLDQRTGDPSDLRRVYAWSCNTAFAQLGLALGPERYGEYAARFGLQYADTVTGTADLRDIPADIGTIAGSKEFLSHPVALADTAFGQGQVLMTPLDMARIVQAIAADGKLMRPYLVQEVRAGDQVLYSAKPEMIRQALQPQAAQQMRSVMQTSVEIGYAKPVSLPGVTIGAKTGTAETSTGTPHSWFVALAPVEQPRFAIAVITEFGGGGSSSALPIARQVLAAALGVQP